MTICELHQKIADRLREKRNEFELTRDAFKDKERFGVSKSTVQRIEEANGSPSLDTLMRLCLLYQCNISDLIHDMFEKNPIHSPQLYRDKETGVEFQLAIDPFSLEATITAKKGQTIKDPYIEDEHNKKESSFVKLGANKIALREHEQAVNLFLHIHNGGQYKRISIGKHIELHFKRMKELWKKEEK